MISEKLTALFGPQLTIHKDRLQTENASGEDILLFQRLFNKKAKRYSIEVPETGVYDEQTRLGVSSFQRFSLSVINADGFVGPETAKRLRIKLLGE